MRRLVLASSNLGKLREFDALLAGSGVEIVTQDSLGVEAAPEPHSTFVENALAKARHAAAVSGIASLADDSGLCCEALGGKPGVLSARFGGEPSNDRRNGEELLRQLAGAADRSAHYYCVLVAMRSAGDPEPLIAEARWWGEILEFPRGENGFGYDPLFFVAEFNMSAAELDPAVKNRVSHRARAMKEMQSKLASWQW